MTALRDFGDHAASKASFLFSEVELTSAIRGVIVGMFAEHPFYSSLDDMHLDGRIFTRMHFGKNCKI